MHRHLGHGVEQQAELALRDRLAREIALHLGLVAAEIGERKERSADQAAPECVPVVQIEVRYHRVKLPDRAGQVHGIDQ